MGSSIILCGTQADRCDQDEIQSFRTDMKDEFNKNVVGGCVDKVAVVSTKDHGFEEVKQKILSLPDQGLQYTRPSPDDLSRELAKLTGVPMERIVEQIVEVHHHHHHESGGCVV